MAEEKGTDYRSLGEILADAREQREWSVEDVSERTKIAPRQIHALEADDLASLSGPVYARGFVRNLCQLYDLDREWMMTKLDAGLESADETPEVPISVPRVSEPEIPEPAEAGPAEESQDPTWTIETVENARVHRIRDGSRPKLGRWVLAVVVVLVVAVGIWWVLGQRGHESAEPIQQGSASHEVTTPVVDRGPANSDATAAPVTSDSTEQAATSREEPSDVKQPTDQAPGEQKPAGRAQASITPSSKAGTQVGNDEHVPYVDSAEEGITSVLRRAEDDEGTFTLRLEATGPLTAGVSFDGKPRQNRRMQAGDEWVLEAHDHFSVEFSDVSNVIIEVDGVRRAAPRGLRGEWLLYRTELPDVEP